MATDRNTAIRGDQILKHTLQQDDLSPNALVWQDPLEDKDLSTPPGTPSEGDRYLIISGGSGTDWAGQDNKITQYINSAWVFYTPVEGWFVWIKDENKLYKYNGSSWTEYTGSGLSASDVDDFTIKYVNNELKIADRIELNQMRNAFDIAVQGSLTEHSMIDGFKDFFIDESGVDTVNSLNEDYDSTNDLYKPTVVAALELDYMEYANDGAAQAAYVSSDPPGYSSDLCSGGACIRDSQYLTYACESAFDDNSGTSWASELTTGNQSGAAYIGYDFGVGNFYHIRRFTINQYSNPSFSINSVKVEYSDNNSDWTTADTIAITKDTGVQTKDVSASSSHRYWRLLANGETGTDLWYVSEVEMMNIVSNLQSYSESTIKNQGSYSLKGIALITNSLNDTLTKSGLSLDLSGKNSLKFDCYASRTGTNLQMQLRNVKETDTKLLLHLNGIDTVTSTEDASASEHIITFVGTAQLDTAIKKWGSASLLLDGNSDYLSIPDSADWDIVASNSDNWTIDFWVKHTDYTGNEKYIHHYQDGLNYWGIYHFPGQGIRFLVIDNGVVVIDTTNASPIVDSNWHHVALCKVASKYAIYKDGTQINYTDDNSTVTFTANLIIGQLGNDSSYFDGSMDEIRIKHDNIFSASPVVGLTDTITVPTGEHTNPTTTSTKDIAISSANTWETTTWDISGISNANKDAIDSIIIKIINADSANTFYIDNFYAPGITNNMTLINNAETAEAIPSDARIVLFEKDIDSITLNTDIKAYVSRDSGVTWAQATLVDEGSYDNTARILTNVVDLTQSGIGSGTSMKYKITTHNSKSLELRGVGLHWD